MRDQIGLTPPERAMPGGSERTVPARARRGSERDSTERHRVGGETVTGVAEGIRGEEEAASSRRGEMGEGEERGRRSGDGGAVGLGMGCI